MKSRERYEAGLLFLWFCFLFRESESAHKDPLVTNRADAAGEPREPSDRSEGRITLQRQRSNRLNSHTGRVGCRIVPHDVIRF